MPQKDVLQVFTGNANRPLAVEIAQTLSIPLGQCEVGRFPDGEVDVKIHSDVRGSDVFVVQPTSPPVNENLMELLIMIDAFRRASADRVTAVIPYFGYARQDRKAEGRVPISAKLAANLLTTAGTNRVLTIDLHASQIQGFFDIPLDHLYAAPVLVEHFLRMEIPNLVVVSPDVGGVKMARGYAKRLRAGLAIIDKRRIGPAQTEAIEIIGQISDKNILLVDDILATGTSMCEAANVLRERGAREMYMCATHPVLCAGALQKIQSTRFKELAVTNSIQVANQEPKFLQVLSIARLLAEAISRIHRSESVSSLFV